MRQLLKFVSAQRLKLSGFGPLAGFADTLLARRAEVRSSDELGGRELAGETRGALPKRFVQDPHLQIRRWGPGGHVYHASEPSALMNEKEALYRLVTGKSEIAVYPDGVQFKQGDAPSAAVLIPRADVVSVMDHAFREAEQPDVVAVVYRDSEGRLEHFTWALAEKGVSREVSNAIYQIIDGGFRKSLIGFVYSLTHRIDRGTRQ